MKKFRHLKHEEELRKGEKVLPNGKLIEASYVERREKYLKSTLDFDEAF